jgi:copper chaperone CopZ
MRPRHIGARKALAIITCFMILLGAGTLKVSGLAAEVREQTVTLQIEGMTCSACVKDVRAALERVSGVKTVEIHVGTKWFFFSDYSDAKASVTFDPGQTAVDALIKAVESASSALSKYQVRVLLAS